MNTPAKSPAELALQIYNLLEPVEPELRQRVIQSAMTLLGDGLIAPRQTVATAVSATAADTVGFDDLGLGPKALRWVQKNGITRAMLDEVFHMNAGNVDITASGVPGASKREMTVNCYLLCGLRGLFKEDVPSLNESDVIEICKRLTAYDKNNHTSNRKAVGNLMSGSKPNFTLTGPGETSAANLVRQMTQNVNN